MDENERFFFGSIYRLRVQNVTTIADAKNFGKYLTAFWKLDCILSGTVSPDGLSVSRWEAELVRVAVNSLFEDRREDGVVLNPFVLDTFFNFATSKTKVVLNLMYLDQRVKNKEFLKTFLKPLWRRKRGNGVRDGVNVFNEKLLKTFQNLQQITIKRTSYRPLSPRTLLRALDGVSLPPSFRTVVVVDAHGKWVWKAFDDEVVAEFAAKGFAVEVEEEKFMWNTQRTVFISVQK